MNSRKILRPLRFSCAALFLLAGACGTDSGTSGSDDPGAPHYDGPTTPVAQTDAIPQALTTALEAASAMDAAGLRTSYPPPAAQALTYDATAATGLDLIQSSALGLSEAELQQLGANGLVISKATEFPSFAYGYKTIYSQDLPVYVSADSILEAVHRTFDALLKETESQVLLGELDTMLTGMRAGIATRLSDAQMVADADLYLTVALSLLRGETLAPAATADAGAVATFVEKATAAVGHEPVSLFGVTRDEDFSQFEPRGHYRDTETLQRYFRAMMWLGRVDLRVIETQEDGSQLFRRRQFDAAVALRTLMGAPEFALWEHIDQTITFFVGEHDSMTPADVTGLMSALGVSSLEDTASLSDDAIIAEIASGGWGAQRIASRIITNGTPDGSTLPLDRSFLVFGQRYTVDSHTFVNTTFDRVSGRLMPKPLDVAFAALGNTAALDLLAPDLENQSYAAGLAKTRVLVDAHEDAYWEGSFYTRWLGALRTLSPATEPLAGVPATEAWQRRVLSSQLASWAELRHDTILYVKQSYTSGTACEFPDAYVDPYPELYAQLGALGDAMAELAQTLPGDLGSTTEAWADRFGLVMEHLRQMAENQRTGTPHSQELLDFINDAVNWDEENICGSVSYSNLAGWYLDLYINEYAGLEFDPTIADVHTQPTDEGGNDVGKVLHVGTGMPRLMVVTAETCSGPRAYAGLAFSYAEHITDNWTRLNDDEWQAYIAAAPFPDAEWMAPVLAE